MKKVIKPEMKTKLLESDIENIARDYCQEIGVDPDEEVKLTNESANVAVLVPRWRTYYSFVAEVHARRVMLKVLEEYDASVAS